jgi:phosphoserine phosphatase
MTVKRQLNVLPELYSKNWTACDFENIYYNESMAGSANLYARLRQRGYRTLFFSGTNDAIVPTQGT